MYTCTQSIALSLLLTHTQNDRIQFDGLMNKFASAGFTFQRIQKVQFMGTLQNMDHGLDWTELYWSKNRTGK